MLVSRRAVIAMLLLTGLAALAHFSPLRLTTDLMVQNAADATRPVSLPDMALGPANANVTITEYASPSCRHSSSSIRSATRMNSPRRPARPSPHR